MHFKKYPKMPRLLHEGNAYEHEIALQAFVDKLQGTVALVLSLFSPS